MKPRIVIQIVISLIITAANPVMAQEGAGGDAALAEGWRLFNIGSYQAAHENFKRAFETEALKENAGQGLVYSLAKQGMFDEALKVIDNFPPDHKIFGPMRKDVISQKALAAFNSKNYPVAAESFQKMIDMGDQEVSTMTLLGWSLFHQGKESQAAPIFMEAYRQSKDPKSAEAVLLALGRGGEISKGVEFAASLGDSKDPMVVKQAGSFLYGHGMPITASQLDPSWERPYLNAREPRIQVDLIYREKTGDEGTSRLKDISMPVTFSYPFRIGKEISLAIIPVSLDSGAAPAGPMAGAFNLKGVAPERELTTQVNAVIPQLTFKCEGAVRYTAQAGATPLSGEVSAAPTFLLKAQGEGFTVAAYQQPVTESILSYTGLVDPYGDKSWGRALKTGASAEFIFTFMGPHWFSIGAAYNKYSGVDVVDNTETNATVSVGRAFTTEDWSVAAGVFGYMARFDRNSNFFTYGHGGYFSPQSFNLGGLMLSMETTPVDDFWAEVKLSAAYMTFDTEESSRYPISQDAALRAETFPGESISQFGYSAKARVYQLIGDNWMAGAGAVFNKASDYTETIFQLTLRYHFGARRAVLFVKD